MVHLLHRLYGVDAPAQTELLVSDLSVRVLVSATGKVSRGRQKVGELASPTRES